jgi:tRNA isopentenyl-2-thiomethyl-A-37 hydroxylase MiaE
VETIIVSAMIEASCRAFPALSENIQDEELAVFIEIDGK